MLIELRDVEVYVEPDDILSKALCDGDLSIRDAISICEDEAGTKEVLDSIADEDIKNYCDTKGIEIEYDFEMIANSLKYLSQEQRASLLWFIIGINDKELKHLVTMELIIPRLNELIAVKRSNENS